MPQTEKYKGYKDKEKRKEYLKQKNRERRKKLREQKPKQEQKPKSTFIKGLHLPHEPIEHETKDWLTEIAEINKGKPKQHRENVDLTCLKVRQIIEKKWNLEIERIPDYVINHVQRCNSCAKWYAQNKEGYGGIESLWGSSDKPKPERNIQKELSEDFSEYT